MWKKTRLGFGISLLGVTAVAVALKAQPPRPPGRGLGPPPGRIHTTTQARGLRLLPATSEPAVANRVTITVTGNLRVIRSNGMPNHRTGSFPNRGNPNSIEPQDHVYRIPAAPKAAARITPLGMGQFGVAINGVPFDPGAAEYYRGRMGSEWQYEPLSGAIALGIDFSHAHVQPDGAYHYHGLPTGLLAEIKLDKHQHSPLVGWAADGFPIYAVYGYADPDDAMSKVTPLKSSYQLKQGRRPGGAAPGGRYDGTFVADYVYVADAGDLDECNGRTTVTPDFPEGTYAYFLTENWPVIPRSFRGIPSADFQRRGGPPRGPGGRPPRLR